MIDYVQLQGTHSLHARSECFNDMDEEHNEISCNGAIDGPNLRNSST